MPDATTTRSNSFRTEGNTCRPAGHDAAAVAMGDEFRQDADGNLRHGLRTDIDADRSEDPSQHVGRDPFGLEIVEDELDLTTAADHADVAGAAINDMEQS